MAEWLYEDGIGERRAALIARGQIIECRVERDDDGVGAGAVTEARVIARETSGMHLVRLTTGEEALLTSLPAHTSIGAILRVEIVRSAIAERDMIKRAKCRPAADGAQIRSAPPLLEQATETKLPVQKCHAHDPDLLEHAGWSEWMDAALSGNMPFAGGMLRIALTPAMAVIDVDGALPASDLARSGAAAAACAIRALGICGNIIIDLPTQGNRAGRIAAAKAFDDALPPPFERTAVNGYGLLQIIRPRIGPSIAERWQFAPVESAALALLRRAERHSAHHIGADMTLCAHAGEIAWLSARPALVAELTKRCGRRVHLRCDDAIGMGHGHVA
ncbi:MAG: ribonuclease [Sphingopyxis sp.]